MFYSSRMTYLIHENTCRHESQRIHLHESPLPKRYISEFFDLRRESEIAYLKVGR